MSKLAVGLSYAIKGEKTSAENELRLCSKLAEEAGDYSVKKLAEQGIVDFCK
jgi:hypothetical protein